MTGFILLTYGRIGYEILEAAGHIMNESIKQVKVINVYDDPDTADNLPGQIEKAIEQLKAAGQCLILTDLRGCTHFNIARQFVEPSRVSLVSGLNLPMLLRLLYNRDESLVTLSNFAEEAGVMGISTTSDAPAEESRFL